MRKADGLGPANGDGVDISAIFARYIGKGTSEQDAIHSLRSADLAILPVPVPADDGMDTLTATATLARSTYTTTRIIVVLVLDKDGNGTKRVADLRASLTWSAL